jgi:hypothetical protein
MTFPGVDPLIASLVASALKFLAGVASAFGKSNDDIRAELERQLDAELPSAKAWAEHERNLPDHN